MPDDWGGIERYVSYACQGLVERGVDVSLVAPSGSPLGRNCSVPQHDIHLRSKYDLAAFVTYRKLFREQTFDIAITHFSPDYLMPAMAAKGKCGPRMVMTRHVAVPWQSHRTKSYLKLYHRFLAVSEFVAGVMAGQGIRPDWIQVPHAGVPDLEFKLTREQVREQYGMSGTSVGVTSRLVADKGQHVAIAAIRKIEGVQLHLFGGGPDREKLESLATGNDVKFHGQVADVNNILRGLDIVLIPSVWDDAFPLSVLEAMAAGAPIIASLVGGVPEALDHERNALLVPKNDPKALAAAINRLVMDPELATSLGNQAREDYLTNFQISAMAGRLEKAYRSIMTA